MKRPPSNLRRRTVLSAVILLAALGFAYAPIPGAQQSLVVVSGTELEEPLQALETAFKQTHPNIKLTLKFQGSQDIVNNYIDDRNDFKPTVLIPANGESLNELDARWRAQTNSEPFYDAPRPIAKTLLVAIAWAERGKVLFPDGRFRWERVEQAMQAGNWAKLGGSPTWGSFDFVMTDPARSNSGQLTLSLWSQSKLGSSIFNQTDLTIPAIVSLFRLIKTSVYQPPRSTDILLQEFIAKGANDADVATTYESIALYRWQQSAATQGQAYQIYYPNPTIETVSTAAIVRRNVDAGNAEAARQFLTFLTQPEQQAVFVRYGFRPIDAAIDLQTVPNSPWSQKIPGAEVKPASQTLPLPANQTLTEIVRQWERAN